jgi:hypothetical protein
MERTIMPTKKPTGQKGRMNGKARTSKKAEPSRKVHEADVEASSPVLERGDLFFFYRPDVDETSPGGLVDVRRFHLVLRPEGKQTLRLITVGRKKLPEATDEGRSHWAFVDRVFGTTDELRVALSGATYRTETLGERHLPEARPSGEGVYALVRHGRSTVLAYALELPEEPGEVQRAFRIGREGRFVISVKNPEAGSPAGLGLEDDRRADFPEELRERFGDRRWVAADPPEFLDHEGAELVLIGGREAGEDLGIDLEPQPETEEDAEVFKDLHLEKSDRTIRPLFEGAWE